MHAIGMAHPSPNGEPALADTDLSQIAAALDCFDVGIALWDADDRLVSSNAYFKKLHKEIAEVLVKGTSYADFIGAVAVHKFSCGEIENIRTWADQRLDEQASGAASHETRLNGRWVEVRKKAVPDGGTLMHIVDVHERKLAEDQRAHAFEELQRSNEELDRFASVASHDLREPLRKVRMFGDRLVELLGDDMPETGRTCLDRMIDAAGRMQVLIDDLRAFSQVSTKSIPMQPVDLNEVLRDVTADLELRLRETGASVAFPTLPTIDANPTQMRQLFQNLLGNAVKFSKPGNAPRVVIAANRALSSGRGARWQITVTDNGIGFDEAYNEKVFELFQRLHGRNEYEGTGIGLAVCRRIAERHDGTISAFGKADIGATFTITLPQYQPRPAD